MLKQDRHTEPFKVMVGLGESTLAGAGSSGGGRQWLSVVGRLISEYQGTTLEVHNRGIGANAISPRSPGYEASAKPSALERYHEDVIALQPDLFILSYGLNDMRCGMPPEDFRRDLQQIITDVKAACDPVIVLTTVYHISRYDWYPPFEVGSPQATEVFNLVIRQVAEQNDCLLADIYEAEGQADWVIHPDTVHANDLGHLLIAHRVFEVIANSCSGVVTRITESLQEAAEEVARTAAERARPQQY